MKMRDVVEHLGKYGKEVYDVVIDKIDFILIENSEYAKSLYESDASLKHKIDAKGGYEEFRKDMNDIADKLGDWKDVIEFMNHKMMDEELETLFTTRFVNDAIRNGYIKESDIKKPDKSKHLPKDEYIKWRKKEFGF